MNIRFDANSVCSPSCLIRSDSTLLGQEFQQMTKAKKEFVVIGALRVTSFKIYRLILSYCIMQMVLFKVPHQTLLPIIFKTI